MNISEAEDILGVRLSDVDKNEIKKAYRKKSFVLHPDYGGSEDGFHALKEAFDMLYALATPEKGHVEGEVGNRVDGRPISEFGNGYPITEDAKTCEACDGRGYREYSNKLRVRMPCGSCFGSGLLSYPCRSCHGSGKFTRGRGDEVDCLSCSGTGRFFPENKRWRFYERPIYIPGTDKIGITCRNCSGDRYVYGISDVGKVLHRCDECDGVGEIKMWNPVLHRGYLSSGK